MTGIALYLMALAFLLWAVLRGEWKLLSHAESSSGNDPLTLRWLPFLLSILLFIPAFILLGGAQITPNFALPQPFVIPQFIVILFRLRDNLFTLKDNLFTWPNVIVWLITVGLFVWALWLSSNNKPSLWQRTREFFSRSDWQIGILRWTLLIAALSGIVIFFRVYHIQQTPAEPFSDHAEKLLDVYDVTQGLTHIFFPRNTGAKPSNFIGRS